jgi:hypothetical protein
LTLAWDPSPSPQVAGYLCLYGFASDSCTNWLDFGNTTTVTLGGLQPNVTWYFVLFDYDQDGQASPPSNEIEYSPPIPEEPPAAPNPLTGAILSYSRAYGANNPAFDVIYSGFVNGDTSSVLDGTLSFSCQDSNLVDVTTNTPIGVYPIRVSAGQTAANYAIFYTEGLLTITQAVLVVASQSASRLYGQNNPQLTGLVTGIQNNDAISAIYQCAADANSPAWSTTIILRHPVASFGNVTKVIASEIEVSTFPSGPVLAPTGKVARKRA